MFSKPKPDFDYPSTISDIIDLNDFSKRCVFLKKEIQKVQGDHASVDLNLDGVESVSGHVNLALLLKWQNIYKEHSNSPEDVLNSIIEDEDTSLSTASLKKEAELVRRLVRSELATAEAFNKQSESAHTLKNTSSLKPNHGSTNYSTVSWTENDIKIAESEALVCHDEIILSVSIFPGGKASLLHPIHKQEVEIKGSDPLISLRDSIYCLSSKVVEDSVTEPSQKTILKSSAFFFIEDVFYDDPLDSQTQSRPSDVYFEAIKAVGSTSIAAQALSSDPSSIQRASLSLTKWLDLKIRLNKPYLFAHLGGCEHLFMITNVRAATLSEEQTLSLPRIVQSLRVRRRKCRVCEVYAGSKMLINDKLMPENPCVICDKCFEGFHVNANLWYNDFIIDSYYHEI